MESWQVVAELIEAIGARWQPVPEPMHDSWVDTSQPNWQIVASQTIHSQPDNTQMRGQKTNEDTYDNWGRRLRQVAAELTARADKLQLSCQTVPEPTHCSWAYRFQLRWKCSALCDADTIGLSWHIAPESRHCSSANRIVDEMTHCIWTELTYHNSADIWQLSQHTAAELTDCSWFKLKLWNGTELTHCSLVHRLSWQTAAKLTHHD